MVDLAGLSDRPEHLGRGRVLDRLCESLADLGARTLFTADEEAYCLQFGLNRDERRAIADRDYVKLTLMGAQLRMLARLAELSGLDVVDEISKQLGLSEESVLLKLLRNDSR